MPLCLCPYECIVQRFCNVLARPSWVVGWPYLLPSHYKLFVKSLLSPKWWFLGLLAKYHPTNSCPTSHFTSSKHHHPLAHPHRSFLSYYHTRGKQCQQHHLDQVSATCYSPTHTLDSPFHPVCFWASSSSYIQSLNTPLSTYTFDSITSEVRTAYIRR